MEIQSLKAVSSKIIMSRIVFQELEIPPRPILTLGGIEPHRGHGPFHPYVSNQDPSSKIFRLTWVLQVRTSHAAIQKFEIFGCIQRLNSSEISRWTKIAELFCTNFKEKTIPKDGKVVLSRRMCGFDTGFRYQIVVRAVDIMEREGPFSKPTFVIV